MTNETWTGGYDKFLQQPFELVYKNESEARDPITDEEMLKTFRRLTKNIMIS